MNRSAQWVIERFSSARLEGSQWSTLTEHDVRNIEGKFSGYNSYHWPMKRRSLFHATKALEKLHTIFPHWQMRLRNTHDNEAIPMEAFGFGVDETAVERVSSASAGSPTMVPAGPAVSNSYTHVAGFGKPLRSAEADNLPEVSRSLL